MIAELLRFVTPVINYLGYGGMFILMSLESCGIPIPSELVVPLAGYMSTLGVFDAKLVIVTVTLANLVGSLIFYALGERFGREFAFKYGKYLGMKKEHLIKTEKWFRKHGDITVFVGRVLPAVRTYISFPAGMSKMKLGKFCLYTLLGSFIWNSFLTYAGIWFGLHWFVFEKYLDLVGLTLAAVFVFYLWRKTR